MPNYIWVVEMLSEKGKWEPTVGCYLTRSDARREKKYDWEYNNPKDKFRIRKYVAEKE